MRRRTVDAYDSASSRTFERVGLEATPARHVPDGDLLMRQDVGGAHQIGIEGDGALVIEVGMGDGGAVDLGLEDRPAHRILQSRPAAKAGPSQTIEWVMSR